MPTAATFLREIDRAAVEAAPERAYDVVRAVDLYRLRFIRTLFRVRGLPDEIKARLHKQPAAPPRSARIDDIAAGPSAFRVLGEEYGREVVVGAIGKFWQPSIPFAPVTPETFASFAEPGFGRVAWCLRVDPRPGGGSWITVDLRVGATDADAWDRFKPYWLLIGRFSRTIRRQLIKALVQDLGRPPPDQARPVAGDDILPAAKLHKTHTTTIEAPPARVWPWLVQMGCRRAGWYSFDRLDNGGVPSADRIIPELQCLAVGDILPATPDKPGGFAVLRIEPERALVIGAPGLLPGGDPPDAPPWRTTWAFALEPIGADATRLVVRVRADYRPGPKMAVVAPIMGALHEVMERRQLHNLCRRAEGARTHPPI